MAILVEIRYIVEPVSFGKWRVMDEVLEGVLCECYTEETAKIIARVMNRENGDFCIVKKVK